MSGAPDPRNSGGLEPVAGWGYNPDDGGSGARYPLDVLRPAPPIRPHRIGADPDFALGVHLVATGRISPAELADCLAAVRRGDAEPAGLSQELLARGLVSGAELRLTVPQIVSAVAAVSGEAAPPLDTEGATTVIPAGSPTRALPDHGGAEAPPSGLESFSDDGARPHRRPHRLRGKDPAPTTLKTEVRSALRDPARRIGGHHVLIEEIGRGGMGVVWRGFDVDLRRPVAIKVLHDPAGADDEQVLRFHREAVSAARLRHPGIVTIHEVGVHEDRPYLVMDLIDGASLEALLARGALAPKRTAEIVRAVALSLDHAHRAGLCHRDVKPENILVDGDGRPHLLDFGLARPFAAKRRITRPGQLVGTPAYMAPEQARGSTGTLGPATDIYALGAVLYRAIVGRPPFEAENVYELLQKVLFDAPESPRAIRPSLHPELARIALRCLDKDPARRYPTARELADELRRFVDDASPVGGPLLLAWAARRPRVAGGAAGFALATAMAIGASVAAGLAGGTREAGSRSLGAVAGLRVPVELEPVEPARPGLVADDSLLEPAPALVPDVVAVVESVTDAAPSEAAPPVAGAASALEELDALVAAEVAAIEEDGRGDLAPAVVEELAETAPAVLAPVASASARRLWPRGRR